MAVKAALLHQAGSGVENRLMRAIGRSAPAPQGLCVLNADGQVLDWSLMFDNAQSVLDFLAHSRNRFNQHPNGTKSLATHRYMRFPGQKLEDAEEPAKSEVLPEHHAMGQGCPQKASLLPGTLIGRVCGRALDADGKPSNDTTNQEHYAEDRFTVSPALQAQLVALFGAAGEEPIKVTDEFAKLLTQHAYLGHLDVRPLQNPAGAASDLKRCEFWARHDAHRPEWFRIAGQTDVEAEQTRRPDGAGFRHAIALTWEGVMELNGRRITRLLLIAHGREQLEWRRAAPLGEHAVAHLPAGRPIDMAGDVRYGVTVGPAD